MIGIRQQDADAEVLGQVALAETFDGGLRAHRHKYGGFDGAVSRVEQSRPGSGVRALGQQLKRDLGQIRL